jgi:hypothetical protein
MKFICLRYMDEKKWNAMSKSEQDAMLEECFAYDDMLLSSGHRTGNGEALQNARTAKTLRWKGGRVLVTDGPYAETKEQLGGVAGFKFRDMDHAIEVWLKHPCLRIGDSLEIRPADEQFNALVEARQYRVERD